MEEKKVLKPGENGKSWYFKPGNPGGPGRPKGSNHIQVCKQFMEEKGWDILFTLAEDKDKKIKYEATRLLLSYGYGKPPETATVNLVQDNPLDELNNQELEELKAFHGRIRREDRSGTGSEDGGSEVKLLQTEPGPTKVD